MNIRIEKGRAFGEIAAPPSKSMAHRLLICAAMSEGVSTVRGIPDCDDVAATLDCLRALGIDIRIDGDTATVYGKDLRGVKPTMPLFCKESGSTLRFLIPSALLCNGTAVFYGAESLMRRPMDVYEKLFSERGVTYVSDGSKIVVGGNLCGGEFTVVGNISSQFISGLIFALPCLSKDSTIKILPPIESRSYIELTLQAVRQFGIVAEWIDEYTIKIPANQSYKATDVTVEGDYSGAAFIDSLNLFGGQVSVRGLNEDTLQGDSVYKKFYGMLSSGVPTIHIGDCPDLGPILFAVAAAKNGGVFSGTKRLKIKESDRAAAMAKELKKFGTTVSVYENTVVIYPSDFHAPSEPLFSHNDHRIVMSLAILLTLVGGEICGAEAINKSYPAFFDDLKRVGISVTNLTDSTEGVL